MDKLLLILALLAAVVGFFTLSEATMGVGIIGLACLFGIFTRLAQAEKHQEAQRQMLKEMDGNIRKLGRDSQSS